MKYKKVFYTWEDLNDDLDKIIFHIKKQDWNIKQICGVPRGGLILAVMLSHKMNIPVVVHSIRTMDYIPNKDTTLIVDDISDTGETLKSIKYINLFKSISLYIKEGTKYKPKFFCRECKDDDWIIYPWENKESKTEKDNK